MVTIYYNNLLSPEQKGTFWVKNSPLVCEELVIEFADDLFLPIQDRDGRLTVVVLPYLDEKVDALFYGVVFGINETPAFSAAKLFKCFFTFSTVRAGNVVNLCVDFSVQGISWNVLSHISMFT